MKSFIKDLSSVVFSKFTVILFNLSKTIIIARWLGPEDNGIIAALIVYPSLFITFGSLGVQQATAYFIGKAGYDENKIKNAVNQIWIVTSLFCCVVSYILIQQFSNVNTNMLWVLLAIVPIPFSLFNTYTQGIYLGKNQISAFNRINWIPVLVVFLVTAILVVFFLFKVTGVLVAAVTGPMFLTAILCIKQKSFSSFSFKIEKDLIKELLSLGLIYALALVVINLNYRVDVILIDKLSTPYELGIYSKGVSLIEYMWQIPMVLSSIIFARSAVSKDKQGFSLKVGQLLRVSIVIIFLGCLFLYILSDFVIVLLYGDDYLPSATVLNILLPGVLLLTIFKVLNMDLAGKGKPWVSMKAMVPALIINVALNFLFVPKYGANGASLASTISYSAAAILFIHFYSKEVQIPIKVLLTYKREDFAFLKLILEKLKNKNGSKREF